MKTDSQEDIENIFSNQDELISANFIMFIMAANEAKTPYTWMQYIKNLLKLLSTQDPSWFHFEVARTVLNDNTVSSDVIDLLARKFLEACHTLNNKMKYPKELTDLLDLEIKTNRLEIICLNDEGKYNQGLFENGLFTWDRSYLNVLKNIGAHGEKVAKWLETDANQLKNQYKQYSETKNEKYMKEFWFQRDNQDNSERIKSFHSRAFLILCEAIWLDQVNPILNRKANGYPALVKPVVERMIPISSPNKNKKFIEKDESIIYCDPNGNPLLMAPAVDPNMISLFQRGAKGLSTLTGHKILRWQVNNGFERWASGENDPRLIEVDGGYSKIAELIKCSSKTDIAKIKAILHAQAHGHFIFSDGSHGNMITLRIEDRYKNQEPSKIHIVLGEMLLPAYVCQFQRSDKRLIPIGELPPLHGSPNSHASQAQLQLLVFKEFSNQSDRLAEDGSVLITTEQWKQLAQEAGLSPDKVNLVIDYWCQSDLLNCFLERQGNEFRLAPYYERAQKFLENQGNRRIINSQRGKKSTENRKLKKN